MFQVIRVCSTKTSGILRSMTFLPFNCQEKSRAKTTGNCMENIRKNKTGPSDFFYKLSSINAPRFLSTLNNEPGTFPERPIPSATGTIDLMENFKDVLKILTTETSKYNLKQDFIDEMFQYNVTCGYKRGGITTVFTYYFLAGKDNLTSEKIKLACYLGWCYEMVLYAHLIFDDIMDGGLTRRGKPCWHKLEKVGSRAVIDGVLIQNSAFLILKEKFSHLDCYLDLVEIFNKSIFTACCGQEMDMEIAQRKVTTFTKDEYKTIVLGKTVAAVSLPVLLALHLYKNADTAVLEKIQPILTNVGYFVQAENDFLDCFGNPEAYGKIGTDIEQNKCTWLAIKCLEKATKEQKELLENCYGHKDPKKVETIKKLYEELNLPHEFTVFKKESYDATKKLIDGISGYKPKNLFRDMLYNAYGKK